MPYTLLEDATAVLLPAFSGTVLSDECKKFLATGGVSILLGESREEYLAREMSETRRAEENLDTFHRIVSEAKSLSDDLIVSVDQEIGGICRLHNLAPHFPDISDIPSTDTSEIEEISNKVAMAARGLGVNSFLAPILDIITGQNPWLNGRTFSVDPETVSRVSSAYVRGVQKAGVAATAKHFPGFHNIAHDPAIEANARVSEPKDSFEKGFIPFKQVIADQVEMIMVGPAIVEAFDLHNAALRSKTVINMLKFDFSFNGVVMADDLDSKATQREDSIQQVAIDAMKAGCDFLLLADVHNHLSIVASALADAAKNGTISREALASSATKVRNVARKYELFT